MNVRADWQIEQYSEELKDATVRAIPATELYGKGCIDEG